jgi:hypothetical protein
VIKWSNARSQKEGLTPCYTVSGAVMKTGTTAPTVNWSANGYRLPTEAEWEKAARGGVSGKRFPWGTDTISHSQANYYAVPNTLFSYDLSGAVDSHHPSYNDGTEPYTSPLGSFAANGYGLHDMAGNVAEWCWDWYGASTYVNGATDPRGAASGTERVYRGGSWGWYAQGCRAADRSYNPPSWMHNSIGFRIARSSIDAVSSVLTSRDVKLDTRNWSIVVDTGDKGIVIGSGTYLRDTNATLTATPLPGYLFGSWGGDATGSENPTTVLMDANKAVGASFVEDTRDPDADGLTNYQEIILRLTNPDVADTDSDGVEDGQEVTDGTNPKIADSDSDGLNDGEEKTRATNPLLADTDGDGLGDQQEILLTITDPKLADSNGNGTSDSNEDSDNDGIINDREVNQLGTNPKSSDSDGDGLSDTYEVVFKGTTEAFNPCIGNRVRYDFRELGFQGTYKLVGTLPTGLTFNATTGVIEGKLTGKPGTSALTVQILNGSTVVRSIPLSLPISAFPTSLTGTWQVLLSGGGIANVTLSSPGVWSATLDVAGSKKVRTAKGEVDLTPAIEDAILPIKFPAVVGTPGNTLELTLTGNDAIASGYYSQSDNDQKGDLYGFRLASNKELPASSKKFNLAIYSGNRYGFEAPGGWGWACGSVSTKGAVTLTGQLGDTKPLKANLRLGATGQAIIWLKPYSNLNSFVAGIIDFTGSGIVPETKLIYDGGGYNFIRWCRDPDPKDASYPNGFNFEYLEVIVRSYDMPINAQGLCYALGSALGSDDVDFFAQVNNWSPDYTLNGHYGIDGNYRLIQRNSTGWSGGIAPKTGILNGFKTYKIYGSDNPVVKFQVSGVLLPLPASGSQFNGPWFDREIVGAGLVKIPITGRSGAFRTVPYTLQP